MRANAPFGSYWRCVNIHTDVISDTMCVHRTIIVPVSLRLPQDCSAINHHLSDFRNTTGQRAGGTFYTEAAAMLRPLRLRVRSAVRLEMEGGKAHCSPRDGRIRNQKQERSYRSDISRGGEYGKQHSYNLCTYAYNLCTRKIA